MALCHNGPMPSREQILKALEAVIDPELRQSIVELGMVRSIDVRDDASVAVMVSLTTPGCPIRSHFQTAVAKAVTGLGGVSRVDVSFDVLTDTEKGALQRKLGRSGGLPEGALAQVSNVVCVGSGKGGVGKSTITANLAAALAAEGKQGRRAGRRRVGLLDPAHVRRRRPAPGLARAQDPAAGGPRREGHVDRLLRRGGRGRRLARADAAQGADPVPRGRRLGRAGLPARGPAAGHRRRRDDARPAAAPGTLPARHHPAADRPEGRPARRRDGPQGRPRDRGRRREHGRPS